MGYSIIHQDNEQDEVQRLYLQIILLFWLQGLY